MRSPVLVFNTMAWDFRLFQHHRGYWNKTHFPSHNWRWNGFTAESACLTAISTTMLFNPPLLKGFNIVKRPICQNSWVVVIAAFDLPHCILGPLDHENTNTRAQVDIIKVCVEHDPVKVVCQTRAYLFVASSSCGEKTSQ